LSAGRHAGGFREAGGFPLGDAQGRENLTGAGTAARDAALARGPDDEVDDVEVRSALSAWAADIATRAALSGFSSARSSRKASAATKMCAWTRSFRRW